MKRKEEVLQHPFTQKAACVPVNGARIVLLRSRVSLDVVDNPV
jgi:hypothetical protein